jgi:hypothetical protein
LDEYCEYARILPVAQRPIFPWINSMNSLSF